MLGRRTGVGKKLNGLVLFCLLLTVSSLVAGITYFAALQLSFIDDHHQGSVTIPAGDFFVIEYDVYGRFPEIRLDFVVDSGPNIDVYLLMKSDYLRFQSGLPPRDNSSWAYENIHSVDESPYAESGHYWAVIDNSDFGLAKPNGFSAVVHYDVRAGGIPWGDDMRDVIILAILGFLFFLGLILLIVSSASEKRNGSDEADRRS